MGVAHTTVTNIYESARSKLAEALVDGKILRIGGGSYQLEKQGTEHIDMKGDNSMRIEGDAQVVIPEGTVLSVNGVDYTGCTLTAE